MGRTNRDPDKLYSLNFDTIKLLQYEVHRAEFRKNIL